MLELKFRREAQPPAGCAELASEIVRAVIDEVVVDPYGLASYTNDAIPIIAAKLAPLFGLLGECREIVAGDAHDLSLIASQLYDSERTLEEIANLSKLVKRIDAALGKGDAGGEVGQ